MIEDLRKSINSILYQRVTSPLFGTFFVAWLLWNWKIVYTTFIIDEDKIDKNKIDYIVENFNDLHYLVWYPLLSTLILLTIIPFISNGAYYLNLKFDKWKVDNKHKIEKKQLITLEQSIQLREQIVESERKFDLLLESKNQEIKQLKIIIEEAKGKENLDTNPEERNLQFSKKDQELYLIQSTINDNKNLGNARKIINQYIQGGYPNLSKDENISSDELSYFEFNDLIERQEKGNYKWTEKGRILNRLIYNDEFI